MARTPQPCGTISAYMRHRKTGVQPCSACLEAWAAYSRERRIIAALGQPVRRLPEDATWDDLLDDPRRLIARLERPSHAGAAR